MKNVNKYIQNMNKYTIKVENNYYIKAIERIKKAKISNALKIYELEVLKDEFDFNDVFVEFLSPKQKKLIRKKIILLKRELKQKEYKRLLMQQNVR